MSGSAAIAEASNRLASEDLARARWYAFFSRWLLAAPDRQAIDQVLTVAESAAAPDAAAPDDAEPQTDIAIAWNAFVAQVRQTPLDAMRDAYDAAFISVGQAPVGLHASTHLSGFSNERPLADVRAWLSARGIRSREGGLVTEDHLGLLCEVMAWLIVDKRVEEREADREAVRVQERVEQPEDEAAQRELFQRWIAPVFEPFADQLVQAPDAGVYRPLGRLFAAFCEVERQAFEMDQ